MHEYLAEPPLWCREDIFLHARSLWRRRQLVEPMITACLKKLVLELTERGSET